MTTQSLRYGVGVGVLGVLIVVVAGAGIAGAANGGSLELGEHNTATHTTVLSDSHGTPLELLGKHSDPPLTVNSSTEVKHLNVAHVGGKSAGDLQTDGSTGHFYSYYGKTLDEESFPVPGVLIVDTAKLPPGNYFVDASAGFAVNTPGNVFDSDETIGTHCYIGTNTNSFDALTSAGSSDNPYTSVAMTVPIHIKTAEVLGEYCYTQDTSVTLYNAAIDAIRIAHQTTGTHINKPAPGGVHPIVQH